MDILVAIHSDLSKAVKQECLEYIIMKIPDVTGYLLQKDYAKILERLQTWYKRHEQDDPLLTELEITSYLALNKPDDELFSLLISIKKKRPKSSEILDIDRLIQQRIEKYPLLQNTNINLAIVFSHTIRLVMKGDHNQALDAFISIQNIEIEDSDIEAYLLLGQNLSAAAGHTKAYIYFKKMWISFLIGCARKEEAERELHEFEQLLPNDEDFVALREQMI